MSPIQLVDQAKEATTDPARAVEARSVRARERRDQRSDAACAAPANCGCSLDLAAFLGDLDSGCEHTQTSVNMAVIRRYPAMSDIKSPSLLYLKGTLMLMVGVLASVLLIASYPEVKAVILLAVAVWGFCRAYYFAFYVVEHYIDPGYRYAGLVSFVRHSLRRRRQK